MPSGVVSHCMPCLLVWCLTVGHDFWCGASPQTVVVGVDLTIGHACWSIGTSTNILLFECGWKTDGYNSVATLTEVPIHQTRLLILCHSQIWLLVQSTLSDMHAGFIYSDTHVCKVLLHQARHLVCYKSTRYAYR